MRDCGGEGGRRGGKESEGGRGRGREGCRQNHRKVSMWEP